jgi:hypothetical protein
MKLSKKQNVSLIVGFFALLVAFTSNAQDVLTNQSIIALCEAKVAKGVILQKINSSKSNFDVSTSGLVLLKTAKVPDVITENMLAVTSSRETIMNEDIIRLAEAKVAKNVILKKIRTSSNKFDLSTEGLIRLKAAKVPDVIVKSMMVGGSGPEKEAATAKPAKKK